MQSRSHATAGQLRLPRPVTLNWDSTHPKLQCHDPLLPATYLVPATICKDSEIAAVKKKVDDLYFSVTKLRNHHTKRSKIMFRNNECESIVEDVESSFGPHGMLRSSDTEDKILRGQFYSRERKFFNGTRPDSMHAHDFVILPTFYSPFVPAHMCVVGDWVSIFLDLKNERFQLLDSYYGPSDESQVR
ncbi:hypothetical protein D1007_23513 [Hordeum vulgare]|nr:hypothetical protein D1007_23513 [Hordeum vulgare]